MLTGEIHGDARKTRQSSEDNDDHSEDKWHGKDKLHTRVH